MKEIILSVAVIVCLGIFPANTFAQAEIGYDNIQNSSKITLTEDEYKNLLIQTSKVEKLREKAEQNRKAIARKNKRLKELDKKDKTRVKLIPNEPIKDDPWQWAPAGTKRTTSIFDDVVSKPSKAKSICTKEEKPVVAVIVPHRDERNDRWIADIHRPGLTWYGYYSPNGRFIARFYQMNALSDFSTLMPHNYRYYHVRQPQISVEYLGSIRGKVPTR